MSRFISEDPLPSPRNLYAYARNNPVRYVDPRGAAEIRAFGHTIAVFGSLTLGPINFQVDLEQVKYEFGCSAFVQPWGRFPDSTSPRMP